MSNTPEPEPVDPNQEPLDMRPSATGLVVPGDDDEGPAEDDADDESRQ